nr:hypothetical protein OG781_16910 [Streptomyces sp. NBC_00830]
MIILRALTKGVVGDHRAGLELLQPTVAAGPRSAYTLLVRLAETASRRARLENGPGTLYMIEFAAPVPHLVRP